MRITFYYKTLIAYFNHYKIKIKIKWWMMHHGVLTKTKMNLIKVFCLQEQWIMHGPLLMVCLFRNVVAIVLFIWKYIKIMFFYYFKKIIFNMSASKWSENTKKILIWKKNNFFRKRFWNAKTNRTSHQSSVKRFLYFSAWLWVISKQLGSV
jgi:hypothetical protein